MINNRVSLGFDLRIAPDIPMMDRLREGAFLETHRTCTISADPGVWPMHKEASELWSGLLPNFLNPLYLAASLDRLLEAYGDEGFSLSNLYPICVTSDPTITISLNKRFGPGYFENQSLEIDLLSIGWRFLGFEPVELNGLTSGLKGIGYKEPSWSQYRAQFGGALNEVGLFRDEETAAEFAKVRGEEIPSHAPFEVVGILVHDPIC